MKELPGVFIPLPPPHGGNSRNLSLTFFLRCVFSFCGDAEGTPKGREEELPWPPSLLCACHAPMGAGAGAGNVHSTVSAETHMKRQRRIAIFCEVQQKMLLCFHCNCSHAPLSPCCRQDGRRRGGGGKDKERERERERAERKGCVSSVVECVCVQFIIPSRGRPQIGLLPR